MKNKGYEVKKIMLIIGQMRGGKQIPPHLIHIKRLNTATYMLLYRSLYTVRCVSIRETSRAAFRMYQV